MCSSLTGRVPGAEDAVSPPPLKLRVSRGRIHVHSSRFLFPVDRSDGVSLPGAADDLLHHPVGAGGGRGPVPGAERTQPGVGALLRR